MRSPWWVQQQGPDRLPRSAKRTALALGSAVGSQSWQTAAQSHNPPRLHLRPRCSNGKHAARVLKQAVQQHATDAVPHEQEGAAGSDVM